MSEGSGSAMYQEAILEHYKNPQHYGELDPHTFKRSGENPLCGDTMEVALLVGEDGVVTDARFTGQGCAISQAAADILLDAVVGKPLDEVRAIDDAAMVQLLGIEVSPMREKCAVLGLAIVRDGIKEHEGSIEHGVTRVDE